MKQTRITGGLMAVVIILILLISPGSLLSQVNEAADTNREELISAAHELIKDTPYCALITLNQEGQPHIRIMDPFAPDENFVIRMGTNVRSRKVQEIRDNPQVILHYTAPEGAGYVNLSGTAQIIDDPAEEAKWWKPGWEAFYPEDRSTYVLIKFTPDRLEVLSYRHNIPGDEETWAVPSINLGE